eukprot:TRINITY_DN586_c0_g1_i2.p1 TRINITY_DN586_c0_g1~~TRINITY_DN586_c0_g1_i2.p1  ORF type:complete len:431 (+),score=98.38 TRINITY_DN586_c0_g1_i2:114-1295(+)
MGRCGLGALLLLAWLALAAEAPLPPAVGGANNSAELGMLSAKQLAARRRGAKILCAKLVSAAPALHRLTPLQSNWTIGPLCWGGRAGSPMGPCFQLSTANWHLFSPYVCRAGEGRAAAWAPHMDNLLRNQTVVFLGDSIILQTAAAFLCGLQQTGHRVRAPSGVQHDRVVAEAASEEGFVVPSLNLRVNTVWLPKLASVAAQRSIELSKTFATIHRLRADFVVVNIAMHYGGGGQMGVWRADFMRLLDSLAKWTASGTGRRVMVAQTLATHWKGGSYHKQLCNGLQRALEKKGQVEKMPKGDDLAALGGGSNFCRAHRSIEALHATGAAVLAAEIKRMAMGRPRMLLWERFMTSANNPHRHPGAYWIGGGKIRCDCLHQCYDDWHRPCRPQRF